MEDKLTYDEIRKLGYNMEGATIEALIVAQQEYFETGDDTELRRLQEIRARVKANVPKPIEG